MKKKEWNEGLNHLDPDLVETYVEQKDRLMQKNKKLNGVWLRAGVIAACLALMVGAIILVPMMREDEPGVVPPMLDSEDHSGVALPGTDIEDDTGAVWEPETGMLPDFAFSVYISDPDFTNYELSYSGVFCEPQKVGDYFDEITVTASFGPNHMTDISAEVYKVEGVDCELCLCMRYIDDGSYSFHKDFIDFESYYFLYGKSYRFASFDDMRKVIYKDSVLLPNYFEYSQNPNENYYVNKNILDELQQIILSVKGNCVDPQSGVTLEMVHANAEAYVASSVRFEGDIGFVSGLLRIYDSGYLYFSAFGGQLFEIGQAKAREIINFVITKGVTENYEWIESEGKWYPVVYDEEAAYPIFSTALEENKLYSQLYFKDTVTYWENVYGASHRELSLSRDTLTAIAQLLNDADGRAVKNSEIPGFSLEEQLFHPMEAVVFTHVWGLEDGSGCDISVYDCGHVELNGDFYFIGKDVTDRIMDILHGDLVNS